MARHVALLVLLTVSLAPSTNAQQTTWNSTEEFRTEYLRFLDTLAQRVPASDESPWAADLRQKISVIRQQVNDLSDPMINQFSKVTDHQAFTKMVNGLAAGESITKDDKLVTFPNASPNLSRKAPTNVQNMVISDPNFSGAVAGTTCSTTPTDAGTIDGEKIGLYVDRGLSLIAETACESIAVVLGEGTNIPFCVAFGITKGVEVVLDSLIDHQLFCNGLLDGAKLDTILADAKDIHGDVDALDTHLTNVDTHIANEFTALDTHLTNVDTHIANEFTALDTHLTNVDTHIANEFTALDTHLVQLFTQLTGQITETTKLLDADLKQVMKLELTPEGLRKIVPAILTCTGTNCPNVLANCPAAGCSWNNVGPLP